MAKSTRKISRQVSVKAVSALRWQPAILGLAMVLTLTRPVWAGSVSGLIPDSLLTVADAAPIQIYSQPVKVYGPVKPPSVQQVLQEVCAAHGYGEDCAKTLLGMAWKESRFEASAVGDNGRSYGFFQIRVRLHDVPLECARDLRCSADWTLKFMEWNGYPRHKMIAVQCHNGCGVPNGYAASAVRHGKRLWQVETQPVELALVEKK